LNDLNMARRGGDLTVSELRFDRLGCGLVTGAGP
jgi:hypothetical protein